MRRGEIVEAGTTEDIFERPKADYTRMLLDAEPRGNKPAVSREAPIVLSGQNVTIDYTIPGGLDRSVQGQVIYLLRDLQKAHGLSYIFISSQYHLRCT